MAKRKKKVVVEEKKPVKRLDGEINPMAFG